MAGDTSAYAGSGDGIDFLVAVYTWSKPLGLMPVYIAGVSFLNFRWPLRVGEFAAQRTARSSTVFSAQLSRSLASPASSCQRLAAGCRRINST